MSIKPHAYISLGKNYSGLLFDIKLAPGKGLGMFARCDIKKGAEIFREAPMLIAREEWLSLEATFLVLSDEKKKRFLALNSRCNCGKKPCQETVFMKIWDNNSFEIHQNTSKLF